MSFSLQNSTNARLLTSTVLFFAFVACGKSPENDGDGGLGDAGSDAGYQQPAGDFNASLVSDNVTRTYYLHVPPKLPPDAPLLMAFHGAGDTPLNFVLYSGLVALADEKGAILVAPAALEEAWIPDNNIASLEADIRFVLKLLSTIEGQYSVDPKQVYGCGWSRGAGFLGAIASGSGQTASILAGYEWQSPFASGGLSDSQDDFDVLGKPGSVDFSLSDPKRPLWLIHGTADQTISIAQGQTFYDELGDAGWPVTFTVVTAAPHDWLWLPLYGHTNEDLWNFLTANPLP